MRWRRYWPGLVLAIPLGMVIGAAASLHTANFGWGSHDALLQSGAVLGALDAAAAVAGAMVGESLTRRTPFRPWRFIVACSLGASSGATALWLAIGLFFALIGGLLAVPLVLVLAVLSGVVAGVACLVFLLAADQVARLAARMSRLVPARPTTDTSAKAPASLMSRDGSLRVSRGVEIALWVAMVLLAVCGGAWTLMRALSSDGCEGDCRDAFIFGAFSAFPYELIAAVTLAVAAAIVLALIRRRTLWAAVTGVFLVLASLITTNVLLDIGYAPMMERNQRIAQGELPPVPPPVDPTGAWGAPGEESPDLRFAADGTFTGDDGCDSFSGHWSQDSDGIIRFDTLAISSATCDGVATWLRYGRSATVSDGYLYVQDVSGSTIGGLSAHETDPGHGSSRGMSAVRG